MYVPFLSVGGVSAALMGGKFGHGFLSAGVTKGVTGSVHGGSPLIRVAASATIGGTVSEISGGKFANGARTAVYQYLYNEWLTKAASLVVQLAPGYELYQCFAEDCSALEWAMAASSVTPMGKGVGILRKIYKSRKVCCFVAGTQILTKDGYKNIEDVAIGDWVWSKDTETGEQAFKRVVHLFVKHDREIFTLNVLDQDGNTLEVGTTDDHPFFVVGEGWKVTEDLVAGDAIETDGHGAVIVQSVSHDGHTEVTYNFEVEDFHTYYVTKKNLLVHNSDCGDAAEEATKGGDKFTQQVIKRNKPGRDGGQSQHVVEKVNGETTSTTHQVFKDGKTIHQHQDHVGKHGTVRRFSDELTGTKTINAPKTKDTMTGGRLGFPPGS